MNDHKMKNAAYAELTEQGYLPTSKTDRMAVVDIVVDVVTPLIRAEYEEDIKAWGETMRRYVNGVLADLRAKVDVLPCETDNRTQNDVVERADVLALFDGSSDV